MHPQGFVNQLVMGLVRGKDLRAFIQGKKRECSTIHAELESRQEEEVPEQVEQVLQQFSKVFETPKKLLLERELDHQITLKPGAEPFKFKPYKHPHAHKSDIGKLCSRNAH